MEDLLPLIKIPCILLATIGLQITATPPHPPPAKSDEAPSTSLEVIVKQRGGPIIIKLICWLAALAEILLICAQTLRCHSLAKSVLYALGINMHMQQLEQASTQLPDSSESSSSSSPGMVMLYPSFLSFIGTILAVAGGYTRYLCYRELGHLFTFEMSIMKEHKLITTGPYALVRHPAYTGLLCTIVGIVLLHGASGSWVIECRVLDFTLGRAMVMIFLVVTSLITIGLLKRIPKEDEALAQKFGQEWKDWAQRVPFRLFWGVY
ncbi:hypothetical protein BDP27DRAFT_1446582 [Rhodocollybia butyracea]|uniref:Protein-S-isoprenylcysteine O-methyltransferase n=1 Tax=Rhodocollybia butyracea TaxID=206335 RepID=A0A9P5PXJ9_9AGAR|nr:hypothetical protein BDP27DRAFT_1446582 [Rhodocollybia butyracea]